MASLIGDSWVFTTVVIENDWGETGTGFLVERQVEENFARAFLVSNKHVLNDNPALREEAQQIYLHVNFRDQNGVVSGQRGIMPLHYLDGAKKWRGHPDSDVDVIAFDVTALITTFPQLVKKFATYDTFADAAKIKAYDITIGEDILVVGYPIGLRQGKTNFPLVRSGIIASRIGEVYEDEIEQSGQSRRRAIRGFVVDGATVPGSSGSPVLLKPVTGRFVNGIVQDGPAPMFLLGIIAETMYAPVKHFSRSLPSFAGLGLAFDAETIKETIELFFQQ